MAVISINGTDLVKVTGFLPNHKKIVKFEKDSMGNVHGDIIAKKWEVQITFGRLSASETSQVLTAINDFSFTVLFKNPENGETVIFVAYENSRNFPIVAPDPLGGYITEDGALNLIEM